MLLRVKENEGCTHCRSGTNASEAKTSRQLLEHAGHSSKALGAPRLSVRLIDYEVSLQSHVRQCRTFHLCLHSIMTQALWWSEAMCAQSLLQ